MSYRQKGFKKTALEWLWTIERDCIEQINQGYNQCGCFWLPSKASRELFMAVQCLHFVLIYDLKTISSGETISESKPERISVLCPAVIYKAISHVQPWIKPQDTECQSYFVSVIWLQIILFYHQKFDCTRLSSESDEMLLHYDWQISKSVQKISQL